MKANDSRECNVTVNVVLCSVMMKSVMLASMYVSRISILKLVYNNYFLILVVVISLSLCAFVSDHLK